MNEVTVIIVEIRKAGATHGMTYGSRWRKGTHKERSNWTGEKYWNTFPSSGCIGDGSDGNKYILWTAVDGDWAYFYMQAWKDYEVFTAVSEKGANSVRY